MRLFRLSGPSPESPALAPAEQLSLLGGLSRLLAAGQSLDPALAFLARTAPRSPVRQTAAAIRQHLRDGLPLASALAATRAVSPHARTLVQAGESGGTLPASLAALEHMLAQELRLRTLLRNALLYPLLLLLLSLLAVGVILELVIPAFLPLFADSGTPPPWPLRLLAPVGPFLHHSGPYLLAGSLALLWFGVRIARHPRGRIPCARALLALPVLGQILRDAETARLLRTTGTLLDSGLGLLPALELARNSVRNAAIRQAVQNAQAEITAGRGLAASLAMSGLFSDETVHLVRLGEETGKLATITRQHGEQLALSVADALERLVSRLPIVLTLIMGSTVAGIVVSLLLAMSSLYNLSI